MTMKHNYKVPRDWPSTIGNRLFLLGTSEDGPYMEPTLVRHPEQARELFGSEDQGNLVKAFDQAYDRNEDISIYLMRISGKNATLDIEGISNSVEDIYEDDEIDNSKDHEDLKYCLRFSTTRGGAKYNEYAVWIQRDEEREINVFYLQTTTEQFVYELPEYITLGMFAKTFNDDCRMGRHHVMVSTDYPESDFGPVIMWLTPSEPEPEGYEYPEDEVAEELPRFFTGGEDGTTVTKNELYLACDLAYQILQGRPVDIVVPVGMYVDDVHPAWLYGEAVYGSAYYSSTEDYLQLLDTENNNKVVSFHEQLIEFSREQMKLGYMSHGVIGLRPFTTVPSDIETDTSYVSRLAQSTAFKNRHGFTDYANGTYYDKGYFVSVVGMDLVFRPQRADKYHASGAVRYAAMLAGHFDSTTNMTIGDDVELRYELSDFTLQELSRLGIVAFRDSVRKGLVIASGVTASNPSTELHDVSNVRMVQITLAYMNEAVEMVYESEFDPGMRKSLIEQEVRTRLETLGEIGVLLAYDYAINYRADGVKGEIQLTLESKHTVEAIQASAEISYREA